MEKGSIIELQKIDCNCNDCKYLVRSISKRQKSIDEHYKWQKEEFDRNRLRLILKAEEWLQKNEPLKAKELIKEARKMTFQFDESECVLHYGFCSKILENISFIPEVLQLETQECFEHRQRI